MNPAKRKKLARLELAKKQQEASMPTQELPLEKKELELGLKQLPELDLSSVSDQELEALTQPQEEVVAEEQEEQAAPQEPKKKKKSS